MPLLLSCCACATSGSLPGTSGSPAPSPAGAVAGEGACRDSHAASLCITVGLTGKAAMKADLNTAEADQLASDLQRLPRLDENTPRSCPSDFGPRYYVELPASAVMASGSLSGCRSVSVTGGGRDGLSKPGVVFFKDLRAAAVKHALLP